MKKNTLLILLSSFAIVTFTVGNFNTFMAIVMPKYKPGLFILKDSSRLVFSYEIGFNQYVAETNKYAHPCRIHPRDHYTPKECAINQSGPVWFLAHLLGGTESVTWTIQAGKAILVPLLTGDCDDDNTSIPHSKPLLV